MFQDVDVDTLKVIEIKKRLKALGLPVTGNKPELTERLRLALYSGSDAAASPDSAGDTSPSKVKDNILEARPSSDVMFEENEDLDQSQEVGQSEDFDESENLDESEDLDQSQNAEPTEYHSSDLQSSVPAPKPSIKRALPQEETETVKPKKKIVLKRNNVPTPVITAKVSNADEGEGIVSQSCDTSEKRSVTAAASSGTSKNVIKLTTRPYSGLSELDKQEKRAIRFNISAAAYVAKSVLEMERDKNFASTLKMLDKSNKKFKPQQKMQTGKLLGNIPAPTLEVLKKRAERFGENVSSVMKKLENKEKINQRKMKFGQVPSGTKDTDEEEKKKKRAERFKN